MLARSGYTFDYLDDEYWRSYEPALPQFDSVALTRRSILKANQIQADGVFCSDDLGNLVGAIVASQAGLPGSTVESMFLANHKFYSRMVEPDPIRCRAYSVESTQWRAELECPIHLKPASLFFSLLQRTARDQDQLASAIAILRTAIPEWERPFVDLFREYVDTKKFPLAGVHSFLAEEFVDDSVSQHAVEGWSGSDGLPRVWAVSDNNYWPGSGASLDNNSVPSSATLELKTKLESVACDTARRFGMRNTFWNIELWVRCDRRIQVTEVNGRICASMTPLYRYVCGTSQYPAAIKVACGEKINEIEDLPRWSVGAGAMFGISTDRVGYLKDLIDLEEFNRVRDIPGVVKAKLMFSPDTLVSWMQTGGRCCIARTWIVGRDYNSIAEVAAEVRRRVLVAPVTDRTTG
jgi:hypothetical protein